MFGSFLSGGLLKQANINECLELIKKLPGHVYWRDRDEILLGCNESQAKAFGFSDVDSVIGKDYLTLYGAEEVKDIRENDNFTMESGQPQTFEEVWNFNDGTTRYYFSEKIPLKDKNGDVVGLLGISLDITDLKEVN